MRALVIKIMSVLFMMVFTHMAQAEPWRRTDGHAKTIAKASLQLEKKLSKIQKLSEDKMDFVSKKDATNESILNTEIELQEALEVILFWAYKSPNQKRYMKRVSKNVSASQLKALQRVLDTLKKHESWMTDEYAVDYIEKQAEQWAKNDVLTAQRNLLNKTQNIADNTGH